MKKRRNKLTNFMMTVSLYILLCSGCSPTQQSPVTPERSADLVEKHTDADITIPSILIGDEIAQTQAGSTASDNGNGTVTYALKGDEIDHILQGIIDNLADSIQVILDDDDHYPNITAITPNDDYTTFTISLSDGQMNVYESMLVMSFYTIGDRYQIYNGIPAEQVVTTVIYINDADNTVVSKSDSTSVESDSNNN